MASAFHNLLADTTNSSESSHSQTINVGHGGGLGGSYIEAPELPSFAASFHSDVERENQEREFFGVRGGAGPSRGKKETRLGVGWETKTSSNVQSSPTTASPPGIPLPAPKSSLADLSTLSDDHRPTHRRRSSSTSSLTIQSETGDNDDDESLFAQSIMNSPLKRSTTGARSGGGGVLDSVRKPAGRSGRMSVAAGELGGVNSMTLREQEKALHERDQEITRLKFSLHFYRERLERESPETHKALLEEIRELRDLYVRLKAESKKNKKFALESQIVIEDLKKELAARGGSGGGRTRELELVERAREERERRKAAEEALKIEREERDRLEREWRDEEQKWRKSQAGEDMELDRLRAAVQDLETENDALAGDLEKVKGSLEETEDEARRLQDEVGRKDDESRKSGADPAEVERLQEELEELTQTVDLLEAQLTTQKTAIRTLEDERDDLYDQRDDLAEQLRAAENGHRERSLSRAGDEEQLEQERNELRDKVQSAQLELEKKDGDLEEKEKLLQEAYAELDGWTDELKDIKEQNEELRDVLQTRDKENDELTDALRESADEMTELQNELDEVKDLNSQITEKLEEHLNAYEQERAEKDADITANNEEIQALGDRIQELEEEIEAREARERELEAELNTLDAGIEESEAMHEQVVATLKEKQLATKTDFQELAELYDAAQEDLERHRKQVDELSRLAAGLETKCKETEGIHHKVLGDLEVVESRLLKKEDEIQRERDAWRRERDDVDRERARLSGEKESNAARFNADIDALRERLIGRERDLDLLREGSRQLGETHTNDRFALELELERAKRDLVRAEDDLTRIRREIERKEETLGQREDELVELHAMTRDLEGKLSAERQARLNVSDKLDSVQKSFKSAETEAQSLKDRVEDLEQRLTDDQRSLHLARVQGETQRKENSELLLTVFRDVNKILGAEDRTTPANFGVFKETLLGRLRSLGQLQLDFEKKVRTCETGFVEKLHSMKRQLDHKWKQLDHFEASVRKLELVKTSWRNKFAQKQGELDAITAKHTDLASQLASLKTMTRSDSQTEFRASSTRVATLERRLANAQNQLATYDEKMASARAKMAAAETRWDARVKEYESRLKQAEERVKSEKQGGKERAAQLEMQVKDLEKQIDIAKRRSDRIRDNIQPVPKVQLPPSL